MPIALNGASRLYPIIGDPIAQVKSPTGVSEHLQSLGLNALCVPMQVPVADLNAVMAGLQAVPNVDGLIITVPHKVRCYQLCQTASDRSHFLQVSNMLRRNVDGSWHGDMSDGLGMVAAIEQASGAVKGKRTVCWKLARPHSAWSMPEWHMHKLGFRVCKGYLLAR
jgi:shikimate dehydrogenase